MTIPKLQMFCSCNCPVSPTVLALTPDKKLLCVSHCPNCGQETQTAFPLSELEAHCPKPELTAETLATAIDEAVEAATETNSDGFTPFDYKMLKEAKIALE